jgi:circadian clock protein KaiB
LTGTNSLKTNKANFAKPTARKSRAARPASKYVLRLFVAGATARSREAVLRVRRLCEAELTGGCRLEVIDIYQQPSLARVNQIVATPTLIKEFPRPVRRFIGSLLNTTGLFVDLELSTENKMAR